VVRLPRTARDVPGRPCAPLLIPRGGVRLSGTAPALTTAGRQHIERVLGAGRAALSMAAPLSLADVPPRIDVHGQLAMALPSRCASARVHAFAAASSRRLTGLGGTHLALFHRRRSGFFLIDRAHGQSAWTPARGSAPLSTPRTSWPPAGAGDSPASAFASAGLSLSAWSAAAWALPKRRVCLGTDGAQPRRAGGSTTV
jgi:hypothetical protein